MRPLDTIAVLAAGAFAARSLHVALCSNDRIEPVEPSDDLPSLSIVVPARDEERQIEECVRSLLAQRYPHLEVVVVDDRSSDATRAILTRLAREDDRLHIVTGEPLPRRWVGKPWALHQGARRASGDWLLFTDADTVHEPRAAASAMRYARDRELGALSLLSTQELGSLAERAVLPSILWAIACGAGPLADVNDASKSGSALFNGQYILMRRDAYAAIGGHESVKGEIAEDFELAHLLKTDGRYRTMLVGANDLVRTRMYRNLREIWNGFGKNLALGARGNPLVLAAGMGFIAFVAPVPQLLLLRAFRRRRYREAAWMGGATVATMLAAEVGMRRSRFPRGSGAWLPAGLTIMLGILLDSAYRHAGGRGVRWRGRRYGARLGPSPEL